MEPAPISPELSPKPTPVEIKPTSPPKQETKPEQVEAARSTLEKIANGTSVAEATAPKVEKTPLPDREKVDALLSQANELLLDIKDMRLMLTAIASQSADTPLGNEVRMETLRMMGTMSNADMPPDAVIKLDALQKHIKELNLPNAKPENSALLPIIATYNKSHPSDPIPTTDLSAKTVAQLLQFNMDIAQPVWKELTGVEGFNGLHLSPTNILELAKLPQTPENLKKANDMFTTVKHMPQEQQATLKETLMPMLMGGALLLMFFTQITGVSEGGGTH